jgi:hypothetical protein
MKKELYKSMKKCGGAVILLAGITLLAGTVFVNCVTSGRGAQSPARIFSDALRDAKYDAARAMVDNGFDCNENANAFYNLFSKKDLTFEQKIQTAKEVSNDTLSNPYILVSIEPENYEAAIDAFGLDLGAKIVYTDIFGRVVNLGGSILHVAVERNDVDLTSFLLSKDIDVNALDNNNHTALFYAITVFGPMIDWEAPIVENETDAKIKFISDTPYYSNPRQVQERQVANVLALLNAGININQQNYAGWTVLHVAAAAYPEGLRELLIERGVDPALKTNMNRTADDILQLRK